LYCSVGEKSKKLIDQICPHKCYFLVHIRFSYSTPAHFVWLKSTTQSIAAAERKQERVKAEMKVWWDMCNGGDCIMMDDVRMYDVRRRGKEFRVHLSPYLRTDVRTDNAYVF
jgi:hypothetical protein